MIRLGRMVIALTFIFVAALPATAADRWLRLNTTHFEMYSTADEKVAREAIRYFERVREFFMQASPVKPPREFPTRIIAFKESQEFHIYQLNQQVLAFYAPGPLRDSIVMSNPSAESYPVTIHEYLHLVVRHSGLKIPLWLNEGWAEVFSTLKPVRDGVAVGDLLPGHMKVLDSGGKWFTLSELATVDHNSADYNESNRVGMFYSESWALAHMLYLSPEYKNNFGRFIGALNRGTSMDESLQTAFGKTEQQVFEDLRNYLSRKKLYGTVFLTPFERSDEVPTVIPAQPYDSDLMLADLFMSTGQMGNAARAYKDLETDNPKRPDAFAASGYLAMVMRDKDLARSEFRKAFELGTTDPQLCMQLASLDHEAQQSGPRIVEELERAVQLRPDFNEALLELGLMKLSARDAPAALSSLSRVTALPSERAAVFQSALGYAYLLNGNLDAARSHVEESKKAAKTPLETQGADRVLALIEARSKGPAAVRPGEKMVRVQGTALGLRCAAPGSGIMTKMGIMIAGKAQLFDMPDPAAIEVVRQPGGATELKCGPLTAFPLTVEYAPSVNENASVLTVSPATAPGTPPLVINQPVTGLIRRLEY